MPENFEVLLGEHSGGRENSDLLALHHSFEGGADGYFGFSKANIATDQAIHRTQAFHVDLRVDDRFHLIRRFTKWE